MAGSGCWNNLAHSGMTQYPQDATTVSLSVQGDKVEMNPKNETHILLALELPISQKCVLNSSAQWLLWWMMAYDKPTTLEMSSKYLLKLGVLVKVITKVLTKTH